MATAVRKRERDWRRRGFASCQAERTGGHRIRAGMGMSYGWR